MAPAGAACVCKQILFDRSVSGRNRSREHARDFHRNTHKLSQTKSERLITCFDGSRSQGASSCPSARGVPQSEQVTAGLGRTTWVICSRSVEYPRARAALVGSTLAAAAGTGTGRKPTAWQVASHALRILSEPISFGNDLERRIIPGLGVSGCSTEWMKVFCTMLWMYPSFAKDEGDEVNHLDLGVEFVGAALS